MLSVEVSTCLEAYSQGGKPDAATERAAVKAVLAQLQLSAPGKSVELRIPPYAATQIVEGPAHRRGTPKAQVEMSAQTLLLLAVGEQSWQELRQAGRILASGERSDLSHLFPL